MKLYAHFGHDDFVLALGYKGDVIRSYFINYGVMTQDATVRRGANPSVTLHGSSEESWTVTLADTGQLALTGARVRRLQHYLTDETFLLTYGDGIADIDVKRLVEFHRRHGKIATITGVRPPSRFGDRDP